MFLAMVDVNVLATVDIVASLRATETKLVIGNRTAALSKQPIKLEVRFLLVQR